jgi:hypothetical protein
VGAGVQGVQLRAPWSDTPWCMVACQAKTYEQEGSYTRAYSLYWRCAKYVHRRADVGPAGTSLLGARARVCDSLYMQLTKHPQLYSVDPRTIDGARKVRASCAAPVAGWRG